MHRAIIFSCRKAAHFGVAEFSPKEQTFLISSSLIASTNNGAICKCLSIKSQVDLMAFLEGQDDEENLTISVRFEQEALMRNEKYN